MCDADACRALGRLTGWATEPNLQRWLRSERRHGRISAELAKAISALDGQCIEQARAASSSRDGPNAATLRRLAERAGAFLPSSSAPLLAWAEDEPLVFLPPPEDDMTLGIVAAVAYVGAGCTDPDVIALAALDDDLAWSVDTIDNRLHLAEIAAKSARTPSDLLPAILGDLAYATRSVVVRSALDHGLQRLVAHARRDRPHDPASAASELRSRALANVLGRQVELPKRHNDAQLASLAGRFLEHWFRGDVEGARQAEDDLWIVLKQVGIGRRDEAGYRRGSAHRGIETIRPEVFGNADPVGEWGRGAA
jgi:hypothetical protein